MKPYSSLTSLHDLCKITLHPRSALKVTFSFEENKSICAVTAYGSTWNFKRKNWQHVLPIHILYTKISLSTLEKEMLGLDQVNHCQHSWVPTSATGNCAYLYADPRQFDVAVNPPLLKPSTPEPPRVMCLAPCCPDHTPMTAHPEKREFNH